MAKTRAQKEHALTELTTGMKNAKGVVFANFQGLTMPEVNELRNLCKKQHITYVASKKTILERALRDLGHTVDAKAFPGGVAVAFGTEDEVAPAKIVATFAKKHDLVKVFGGMLEGQFIDSTKVMELSKVPGKQELYARLVGTLNAPVFGFVNVLAGNLRGLVSVLNAVKDRKPA